MRTVYHTDNGMTFEDFETASFVESLKLETVKYTVEKSISVIPMSNLKDIFNHGSIACMEFYVQDEDGNVSCEGFYETYDLDKTGHLDCIDYNQGLIEWSESEQSYFKIYYGREEKIKLLVIKSFRYY